MRLWPQTNLPVHHVGGGAQPIDLERLATNAAPLPGTSPAPPAPARSTNPSNIHWSGSSPVADHIARTGRAPGSANQWDQFAGGDAARERIFRRQRRRLMWRKIVTATMVFCLAAATFCLIAWVEHSKKEQAGDVGGFYSGDGGEEVATEGVRLG